ncbi:MAG: Mur ligase family protein, partial [Deltaproteobacteria bacterium]|nr:Mur ligase family protein [Deltaproteobacteria bacterium]
MDLKGMHTAVIGMGRTGIATTGFLVKRGADVTCFDQKPLRDLHGIDRIPEGTRIVDGWDGVTMGDYGLVVVSPGVPMSLGGIGAASGRGAEVISEIELASRFTRKRIVAITGTNGKTSVAHWIAQALSALGRKTAIIGTVGNGFPSTGDRPTALTPALNTTPDAIELQQRLARYRADGAVACAMEVSSHGLAQGRV